MLGKFRGLWDVTKASVCDAGVASICMQGTGSEYNGVSGSKVNSLAGRKPCGIAPMPLGPGSNTSSSEMHVLMKTIHGYCASPSASQVSEEGSTGPKHAPTGSRLLFAMPAPTRSYAHTHAPSERSIRAFFNYTTQSDSLWARPRNGLHSTIVTKQVL